MKNIKQLLLVLAAVAILAGAGAAVSALQDTNAYAGNKGDKLKALETFSQALSYIERSYVEEVDSEKLIYGAISGMLNELDPHSSFMTKESFQDFQVETKGEFGGLGIQIGMRENNLTVIAPIEDTPAYEAGLLAGDMIIKIEGVSTSGITLDKAVDKLRGKPGTKVTITILRKTKKEPFDVTLTRAIIKVKAVKSRVIEENIGYIRLTQFKEKSGDEVQSALKELDKSNVKGIILDLRNNPGGLLNEAINISSLFLPSGKTVVFTRDRSGKENPYRTRSFTYRDEERPVIVLVNEGSASASEIVSGAIQDYKRGIVIGQTTFGKASVQSIIPMHDGSAVKLTTARYYTPKGRSIQGVGIKPDIEVEQGKIVTEGNGDMIKEKDLEGHLVGENEKKKEDSASPHGDKPQDLKNDLQLQFGVNMMKGLLAYGK